jgi:hypothetical protein
MIYTSGDSWTWESEGEYSRLWPTIIAEKLGYGHVNDAWGCGSNSRILSNLENYLITESHNPKLIVIALTSHNRWHLPAENLGTWMLNTGGDIARNEKTNEEDMYAQRFFLDKCYCEIDSVFRYYKIIWSIHNLSQKINSASFLIIVFKALGTLPSVLIPN